MAKILVIAECHDHDVSQGTKVTIASAMQLSKQCDVFYACENDNASQTLASLQGVETVWVSTHARFSHLLAEDLAPIIVALAKSYTHILAPATTFGKNLLPRVAAMLNVAQLSDVTRIESEDTFVRPIYAGNAFQTVRSHDAIKVMTIRTTAFEAVSEGNQANIKKLEVPVVPFDKVCFKDEKTPELTRPELSVARVVVSGGRGLKEAKHFKMIETLADKLGGAVGATRAAVDAGWVPNDWQVGQTGKTVAPQLYIAIGISGATQHLAGMKDSKVIVAINQDPDAPIFQVADYGLVGDLFDILPQLEKAI